MLHLMGQMRQDSLLERTELSVGGLPLNPPLGNLRVCMSGAASIPVTRGLNTLPKKGQRGFLLALYSTQDTYVGILDISDLHHGHVSSHDMSLCAQFSEFLLKLFMVSFTASPFAYRLSVYALCSP